jgi:hypothetical protein
MTYSASNGCVIARGCGRFFFFLPDGIPGLKTAGFYNDGPIRVANEH